MCLPGSSAGQSADGNPPHNKHASDNNDRAVARKVLDRGTLLACMSVVLLITGMSLTYPHMQSRRDELGCDSMCYGTMTSVRSALGLVGTAVVGRLSDKNGSPLARSLGSLGMRANNSPSGRRACLYLGTMATLIGLAIALSMNSLLGLWLSMIPDALLQHNFDVYKALLSEYHNDIDDLEARIGDDPSDEKEKTKYRDNKSSSPSRSGSVGKLGMSLGISFMIGPMIAALTSPTFQFAACFAIVCTVASGIVIFYLPLPIATAQKKVHDVRYENHPVLNKENEFSLMKLLKLQTPKSCAAMMLLVIRLNMSLAFQIFNTVWPASLKSRFNFGPSDHARFMSFIGISYAFSQGFLAKRLVQAWGKDGKVYLIMTCCAILGAGRYIAYFTNSLVVIYMTFLFIINALGTMNTVITADTGTIAPSDEIGALFGMLQAAESAAGIVGPFLGGVISKFGRDAPLIAVVGVYSGLFAFVSWGYDSYVVSSNCYDSKHEGSITSGRKEVKKTI
ncbi:hypothetical protein ACHAW5_004259 [Stephanodiscus triporus]|uniref:Major facilitator superfamily (MFS) profile domain-containing protein n=1 Tax=Stephanodiscus triporus TaxID=2934178 RepID=A0ABD3MC50_9STRA